jgi:hypothetical protein
MLASSSRMSPRRGIPVFLAAAASAAALAGNGCSRSIAPIEVAAGCPDQPVRGPDEWASEPADRLIDDFEGTDDTIARVAGRTGNWALGTDGTASGVATAAASSQCAARGGKAGHFTGEGFTNWGANWTAVFLDQGTSSTPTALPYNGTAYSGISFWAAAGVNTGAPTEVPIGLTTMDVAWNGGVCTNKCQDFYRAIVPLTRTWQRVTINFDDLAQAGWGDPQTPMKHDQLVGFIIWPNEGPDGGIDAYSHPFDVWIDDVRFEP